MKHIKLDCGKFIRIRSKDVGRKKMHYEQLMHFLLNKHHYIKIGVRKTKGKRGGRTEKIGRLRKYK